MTPLLGQIVRLTKSLLLRPTGSARRSSAQFVAGKHQPFQFLGGIVLTWWYSDDTFRALDTVATMMLKESEEFRDCDLESASEIVMAALKDVCIDSAIFNVDAVVFSRRETLFDCRAVPVPDCATSILASMKANLRLLIFKRCTIYAVPRFQVTSFFLESDLTHVIARSDQDAWKTLVDRGYRFDGWTPERPIFGTQLDSAFAPPADFACVLVAEEYGTQKGSKFSSVLKFRKVMTVLFAVVSVRVAYPRSKAMARPFEFCMQFPHNSSADHMIFRTDCEPLIPYFISDIHIGPEDIATTRAWYEACALCDIDAQRRIEKGTYFLNRAMNSDDIEAYVNYFITLDALFGRRGAVESSIMLGIQTLGIDTRYTEKTPWLFELRNEIVHGGSRYLEEWPKYNRYTQHFRTKPLEDVRALAQLAVVRAPRALR